MLVSTEIASVTILVSYQKENEMINQIIPFKVFKQEDLYKAIPMISAEERKVMGISAELAFRLIDNRIIVGEEANNASLNAINKIASELRVLRIV
jgi:hypothetical protein